MTHEVTRLLAAWRAGDERALHDLVPLVYGELHRIARIQMKKERAEHTLQTTAVIHEAYLRLVDQRDTEWQNRAHFFAIAAQQMRRILVDHARAQGAAKRGGGVVHVPLEDAEVASVESDVIAIDEALERLAMLDPRQAKIVELRFFGGLTIEETAAVAAISPATVKREWAAAKAFLYRELKR